MFNLMDKILGIISLSLLGAVVILYLYLDSTLDKNTLLEAQIASQMQEISQYEDTIKDFKKDQQLKEEIIIRNQNQKASIFEENNKLKEDLRRLRNESSDKCLSSPIPDRIIERLRTNTD